MKKNWFTTLRYLAAGEESRPGIGDYWRDVFLSVKTPLQRNCLEFLKAMTVPVVVSFIVMALVI